jgi:signal transduction histidine kinase
MENPDVFDLVQESVMVCDLQGRITQWNAASRRLYGWTRSEAVGRIARELLSTNGEPAAIADWDGDVVRNTADAQKLAIRIKKHVRRDSHGAPVEIIETGVNVTAQRRAEEALSRAEHRYYNVFQAMAVSFWELDFAPVGAMVLKLAASGISDLAKYFAEHPAFVREMIRATRVVDVNDQSVKMFGRGDKLEMLADLNRYWPDDSMPVYAASVVAAVQGLSHYVTETRLSALDGSELDVLFTACFPPEMLAGGKLLIGIIDISADKKARMKLQESAHRYRSLFHFLPVPLVQLDRQEIADQFQALHRQGVRDLGHHFDAHPEFFEYALNAIKVVEVNRHAVQLFGAHDDKQLLGPAARLWSEARATIRQSMEARFRGAAGYNSDIKIKTFDGRILDVLYFADFPEAFGDNALGLSCFVDISDRVKAQAALAQLQAEFAHAARVSMLGELTASIAHEINQPLGAILTNGEAALRWLDRPVPDIGELRRLATRTMTDARRAADIIQRIRSMAMPGDAGRAPIALNSVVEESMTFLRPELSRQNVEAVLELAHELPEVVADRVQLQQVFVNLAVNAIQAMIGRSTRRLIIRTIKSQQYQVSAEVEDTGPGVPPQNLDRLFGSFFTTKKTGMGIGLAICRSIIEAHGGRIHATNLNDAGARFAFTLPARQPEEAGNHTKG